METLGMAKAPDPQSLSPGVEARTSKEVHQQFLGSC